MKLEFDNHLSIYLQIAENLENDILKGIVNEEEQVTSTTQFAALYRINPATAAKGINMLVDQGILYKKRGLGMFVSTGAVEMIRKKRQQAFYNDYVLPLISEADSLGINREDLLEMIVKGNKE